jgi:hypothetical protein
VLLKFRVAHDANEVECMDHEGKFPLSSADQINIAGLKHVSDGADLLSDSCYVSAAQLFTILLQSSHFVYYMWFNTISM